MLTTRRTWLERTANWGVAIAVPLVAIGGFRLLAHARDPAATTDAAQTGPQPAAAARVLAPPIDASAPPVVELRPRAAAADPAATGKGPVASGEAGRCAPREREAIGRADAGERPASASGDRTPVRRCQPP